MVTSNCVLTGLVGYRSLELALLELTLFQTVPREMETHSPLDGSTAPPCRASDREKTTGGRAGSRFLQALDRRETNPVSGGVGVGARIVS